MGVVTVVDEGAQWRRPAFSVGEAVFTWVDVVAFARRHGRWDELVQEAGDGLARQRAGMVADADAVRQAAADFRYRHRLITAEEAEAWLRARHVTVAEWHDYIRRTVLRAMPADATDPPAAADVTPLLWPTGRCSGLLEDAAEALAARVAVHVRLTGTLPESDADVDSALDRFRAAAVTDTAIRVVIGAHHLDWLRVTLDEALFAGEGAAREAVLCVREDGLGLADVCKLAGARFVRRHCFLEELDETTRPSVLGAPVGELLGPFPAANGFQLMRVEAKVVPSEGDPEVRQRAAEVALAAAVRREVEERVRRHGGP